MARHCENCHLHEAPWTDEEVENLRRWQADGRVHEFTGPNGEALIPTRDGWVSVEGGHIVQNWAHTFMVDGSHIFAMNLSGQVVSVR